MADPKIKQLMDEILDKYAAKISIEINKQENSLFWVRAGLVEMMNEIHDAFKKVK